MPKPIPEKELQDIEAVVSAHPEGVGLQGVLDALGVCQHSWHIKWFWLFKTLLPAAPGPSRDSGALPLAG